MHLLIICAALSLFTHQAAYSFSGSDGSDGRDGADGRRGQSLTITADGSAQNHNLTGGNGDRGGNGTSGGNASFCDEDSSMIDGSGGDGGDGGDGGNGGDSGDLTVYYQDIADLILIAADMTPGRGASGGHGASGGRGCSLIYSGSNGRNGRNGSEGREGKIYLINSATAIPREAPTTSGKIAVLTDGGTTLTKDVWETRQGARSLFHPSSHIPNAYEMFIEQLSRQVVFRWRAERSIADFGEHDVSLSLDRNGEIRRQYHDDYWLIDQRQQEGTTLTIEITEALRKSEVLRFSKVRLQGDGANLLAQLDDEAGAARTFQDRYTLKLFHRNWRGNFEERHTQEIPAAQISRDGALILLRLGQSGIPADLIEAEDIEHGINVSITVQRSYLGYTGETTLDSLSEDEHFSGGGICGATQGSRGSLWGLLCASCALAIWLGTRRIHAIAHQS